MSSRSTKLLWLTVAEAAGGDLSFSDRSALLDGALREQFGNDGDGCQRFYVQDIFGDYIIARNYQGGTLVRIGYTISGTDVTFGDAQEVETAYVPVAEAGSFVTEAAGATNDDCVYPVTVLKAGWGGGVVSGSGGLPHYYPAEFAALVAEAANGAKFGRRHPNDASFGENDPERIAGWFGDGRMESRVSEARANLNLLKSETDLRSKFSAAREAKKLDMFGLSILATVGFEAGVVEGRKCLVARKLGKLFSIDQVSEAGAGGRFLQEMRVAASADVNHEIAAAQSAAVKQGSPVHTVRPNSGGVHRREGSDMNKLLILRVIESLRTKDATSAAAFHTELNAATEDKYEAIMARVTEALEASSRAQSTAAVDAANATLAEAKKIQFVSVMESALTASKLPEPAKKLVRRRFEAGTGTGEELNAEILAVRESFAAVSTSGRVGHVGVILGGVDPIERVQHAMDRMLGVKEAAASGVPAFRGVREAYVTITGDSDLSHLSSGGALYRVVESFATAGLPNILLNSMTKKLLQDWAELGMKGLDTLWDQSTINDYKLQDRVRDGNFPELPIVAEGAPYLELAPFTDERISYSVVNRGGIVTISEQTIRNDDLGAIIRVPNKLVRAAHKTLKTFVTNFFIANGAYQPDGVNIFDSTHANLASSPLSEDSLIAAEQTLMKQTEKDSGERLGLSLDWTMVPIELAATARQINQTDTAGANAFYQRFGANNERIIVNEKLTDATDWYYGTLPTNAPFLEMGFLDGIVEPQIFLANNPVVGAMFTNDQIQYKVKQVFGGAFTDYRGVGKQVVAG
jgi:hypothetical protein